jgi:AcrR family transcriptional regulator
MQTASKPARAADSRETIMRAARENFFANGYARASVDAVAAAARVSKQTIYEFFPSKTELFEAVVRATIVQGRENLGSVEVHGLDPVATLNRFGRILFDRFVEPESLGLFRANIVATRQLPELAADLHEQRLAAGEPLGRFIETLVAEGVLRPCDPLRAGVRLGGRVAEGSRYFLGFAPPVGAARDALVASNVAQFLHGYRAAVDAGKGARPAEFPKPEIGGQAALRLSDAKLAGLLDAAAAEFFARGYVGAGLDRIAAAAGVSKTTIHRQFVSKEGLFRHIVLTKVHEVGMAEPPVAPSSEGLEQAVATLAGRMLDAHLAPEMIALHHLMIEEADHFPDLARHLYDAQIAAAMRALSPILSAHGWLEPGEDAARAFHTLATFGVRYLTAARFPDRQQRDALSAEAAQIFLHGLAAPARRD